MERVLLADIDYEWSACEHAASELIKSMYRLEQCEEFFSEIADAEESDTDCPRFVGRDYADCLQVRPLLHSICHFLISLCTTELAYEFATRASLQAYGQMFYMYFHSILP